MVDKRYSLMLIKGTASLLPLESPNSRTSGLMVDKRYSLCELRDDRERYGERVIDRIQDVATILTLVGPSYRGSGG